MDAPSSSGGQPSFSRERGPFDPRAALRRSLASLPAYAALEDPIEVARRFGVAPEDVIKIDGNENPYGPSPKALEALRRVDYEPHHYPDANQARLRAGLGAYLGVPPEAVVCGSGSDELITLLFRMFLDEGERIATVSPTFGMYAFNAQLFGVDHVEVPLGEAWAFDVEALEDAALQSKAVFIPSPNNPTGNTLPVSAIDRLLRTGTLVVLDEAYIEFSHQESLARRAATEPGLVVLRTFSKWGGLAGLRFGYAVMHPDMAALLMQAKDPYNVNAAAEAAVLASLEDLDVLADRACTLSGERDRVAEALRAQGWLHPWPSEAIYLLVRLERGDGRSVHEALRRRGVFTRYFSHPRLLDHVRISMGLPEQNDRVIEAFRAIGEELAHG